MYLHAVGLNSIILSFRHFSNEYYNNYAQKQILNFSPSPNLFTCLDREPHSDQKARSADHASCYFQHPLREMNYLDPASNFFLTVT